MSKQSFTTGQVLTAAQVNSLQANDFNQTVSVKTANYTLAAADKGTRIEFNTSGSVTCTVNSGLFDAGDTLVIQNRGAGTATITAGTATVNTSASLALAQYSAGTLYFVSDSAAIFFGDAAGISASIVDAKGDLIVGTADNTVGRLAVGTNGYTLVADSGETTGLKWAAPSGKLKQVVFASNTTNNTNNTTTYSDTGLSATITPTSASSKIYVFASHPGSIKTGGSAGIASIFIRLMRGATEVAIPIIAELYTGTNTDNQGEISFVYEDSPNTTSATTYKTQFKAQTGCSAQVSANSAIKTMILMEVL